ncbi:MAG: chromate transporter [Spirochaetia bacterium]|nr:chromate transporter [Spirochaetia bacterium]
MTAVKCLRLFITFFKISLFTVGGGPVMLAVMDQEFRVRQKLLSSEDMSSVMSVIYSLPGAIGVNSALYIGHRLAGLRGAFAALCGVLIPPVSIILFITSFMDLIRNSPLTGYAFVSIRASVSVFIIFTVLNMARKTFKCGIDVLIAALAFICVMFLNVPAVYVILGCGILGMLVYREKV